MTLGRTTCIMLSPSSLEVIRLSGGRVTSADVTPLDRSDWNATWARGLAPLDDALKAALLRLRVAKGSAIRVFYHSPDAVAEVLSLPVATGEATAAARLALADVVRFSVGTNPVHLSVVKSDRGATPQTHVLAAADQETHATALAGWIGRAGCRPEQFCPARAAVLSTLVKRATHSRGPLTAHMYLGEHTTAMIGADEHKLHFVRCMDFGYDLLVEAMVRGGAASDIGTAASRLAQAAVELFEVGFPSVGAGSEAGRGVRSVLPMLQPVLQRYVVEAKQTLRFGLTESNGVPPSLVLTGPGSAIPGIARVFGEHLNIDVDVDSDAARFSPSMPGHAAGELVAAATQVSTRINLFPQSLRERAAYRRVQAALACGGLLAAGLVGLDAVAARSELGMVRGSLASAVPQIRAIEARRDTQELVSRLEVGLARAKRSLAEAVGSRASYAGLLSELARLGSDRIRITEVRGQTSQAGPVVSVDGVAYLDMGGQGDDALRTYMDDLRLSPTVGAVSLGSTRLTRVEGRSAKKFTIEVSLVPLPLYAAGGANP